MDSTADHEYNPKSASQALQKAITELAQQTGRPETDFNGIRLGDAFDMARETYGDALPDFWKVWNGWNTASDDPAPWGDL